VQALGNSGAAAKLGFCLGRGMPPPGPPGPRPPGRSEFHLPVALAGPGGQVVGHQGRVRRGDGWGVLEPQLPADRLDGLLVAGLDLQEEAQLRQLVQLHPRLGEVEALAAFLKAHGRPVAQPGQDGGGRLGGRDDDLLLLADLQLAGAAGALVGQLGPAAAVFGLDAANAQPAVALAQAFVGRVEVGVVLQRGPEAAGPGCRQQPPQRLRVAQVKLGFDLDGHGRARRWLHHCPAARSGQNSRGITLL